MNTTRFFTLAALALALSACAGKPANVRVSEPAPAIAAVSLAADAPATSPAQPPASAASAEPAAPAVAPAQTAGVSVAEPDPVAGREAATTENAAPPAAAADESSDAEDAGMALYAGAPVKDPWERYNRRMHRFNNAVDKRVLRPLAAGYAKAVPAPVRSGVSRFFSNLGEPATAINQALQGHPVLALKSLGRFAVNTTLGIAGALDPAARMGLPAGDGEDFGQTLAAWGWRNSRYLVLPLMGPRTLRDAAAIVADQRLAPTAYLDSQSVAAALQLLEIVDGRTQMMAFDRMRQEAYDEYAFVRDAWTQRRNHQIAPSPQTDPAADSHDDAR